MKNISNPDAPCSLNNHAGHSNNQCNTQRKFKTDGLQLPLSYFKPDQENHLIRQ